MTNLPYIVEAQICFAILWLFYRIVLRRSNTFAQSRFYLLTMTLVSFIIPLLSIPVYAAKVIVQGGYAVITMPEEIAAVAPDDAQIGTAEILMYIYLTGIAIMLTVLLFNGIKVWRIYKNSKVAERGEASVYHTDKIQSCFSFFNNIFLNPQDLSESEMRQIMTHEMAHIRLRHSMDLILGQALLISLWWNPFVWLWFRTLKEVHEFQADEAVLNNGCNSEYYLSLILKGIADIHPEFVSGFSYSLIKNRLIMITSQHHKRFARFRILFSLPILLVLLTLFSFTEHEAVIENKPLELTGTLIFENDSTMIAKRSSSNSAPNTDANKADIKHIEGITVVGYGSAASPSDTIRASSPNSIIFGSEPVYIIDGVIQDRQYFEKLTSDKIASITIFKDAAAKAYVPNAKNGVIIVKTKDGTDNTSSITETLSAISRRIHTNIFSDTINGFQVNQTKDGTINIKELGDPVYIINGVVQDDPQSLKKLSADKIESISILKDASAIYGPNAKNGVIIIKTKDAAGNDQNINIAITDTKDVVVSSGQKSEVTKLKSTIQFTAPAKPASKDTKVDDEAVFDFVDKMPQFPGGESGLIQWVMKSVRYPKEAHDKNIQGRVLVSFIVKKDGSVYNVEIVESSGQSLSDEAIRVVKSSPKWIPGEQDGKPVNVRLTLPVNFSLK